MSTGICPGACAASASTATPRARSRAAVSRSGKTSALCAVMCSTIASRVRGPDRVGVGVGQLIGAERIRHLDGAHRRAALAGGKERRAQHAAVDQIRDQDLVALAQRKRAEDRIGAGGDVVHEHEVRAARAEKGRDLVGGRTQPRRLRQRPAELGFGQRAQDEAARVALHLVANPLLHRHDAPRRHAHGPVIQVGDARIESTTTSLPKAFPLPQLAIAQSPSRRAAGRASR